MAPDLAERLLAARDQAAGASAPARNLALLAAAGAGEAGLPDLPVGTCDRRLLALRQALLGDRLAAVADCPACGTIVEATLALPALALPPAAAGTVTVREAGWTVTARLPTLADQIAAATAPGSQAARALLLARCVQQASPGLAEDLPEAVATTLAGAMAEADPQADIELLLHCPACGAEALLAFDIGGFLWRELDAWADRLLHEVHSLALAYGWSEAAILALPERRRRHYLGLLAA